MSINRCVQVEKEKDSEMQAPSQPLPLSPTLLEEFSEDEYKFTHAKRGRAVIINNENFSIASGCGNRPGSSQDASRLKEVFKTLGFEVRLYHDLTAQLMFAALEKGICCLMLYSVGISICLKKVLFCSRQIFNCKHRTMKGPLIFTYNCLHLALHTFLPYFLSLDIIHFHFIY